MSTYIQDEHSPFNANPVELYEFTTPVATYRFTTSEEDYVFQTNTFTAVPGMQREAVKKNNTDDDVQMAIELPVSNTMVQAYAFDVAPRQLLLELFRVHPSTGNYSTFWQGPVTSILVQGRIAKLIVPSNMGAACDRDVPSAAFQKLCNHSLYDDRCGESRASNLVSTTVSSISSNGLEVTVASDGGNSDGWAAGGELLDVANNERRMILDHTGNVMTINYPFPDLSPTDSVELTAGCDHQRETCRDKFNNVTNFGGFAFIPITDLWRNVNSLALEDE